jgi:hypothetical protein
VQSDPVGAFVGGHSYLGVRVSRTDGHILAYQLSTRRLGDDHGVTSHISMALLTLSFGTYLLVIGVRDDGPAAALLVLVGAVLFATGLFLFGFTIKNFLFVRRVRLHVKGIKRLIFTTSTTPPECHVASVSPRHAVLPSPRRRGLGLRI